ncbi:hypothetical protein ACLOJK_013391 [Asimina triloba]
MLWMLSLSSAILLSSAAISVHAARVHLSDENRVKTGVFLSPPFFLGPGSVELKYYYNIDFPRGHIALKSFNAEVVDEDGTSIPLTELYVHHWIMFGYYGRASAIDPYVSDALNLTDIIPVWNSGTCQGTKFRQTTGFGSETRRTHVYVPDPYGIEAGNPAEIPDGYEYRWLLNVHAIDTRGVADTMGCTECRCSLYNLTKDVHGKPYAGGSFCCPDQAQCRLRQGAENITKRKLYMRYTVKWVEWDDSIVPVKIYIFDATDTGERSPVDDTAGCQFEYSIEACSTWDGDDGRCVHSKNSKAMLPHGGNIIFGVGHQHWGGRGVALYGRDGRLLCESLPIYGNGHEAGNEDGYVVGMSTCYPKPGTVTIGAGEVLTLVSNYENAQSHVGIMGGIYILVEEPPSAIALSSEFPASAIRC